MPRLPRAALLIRSLRIVGIVLGTTILLFFLLLGIHQLLLPVLATWFPSLEVPFYDLAVFGVYRARDYVSFNATSPNPSFVHWDDVCDSGNIFLGPYGDSISLAGPMILDARGELVWFTNEFDQVTNFQMQQYKGQNVLTFWAGKKVGGVGRGTLYILDETYSVAHTVQAVGGEDMRGDLHEFQITDRDTALITIYNKTQTDLRPMSWWRGEHGWIHDCIFQEVDIETGELLFQWAAIDHMRPERTFYTHPYAGVFESSPFDYFHINSIERDSYGNYLISARHFHTLTYINGSSGAIIWELGGGTTDFTDLSHGAASSFKWQHHARWQSREEGLITLFDNGVAGPLHVDASTSKAVLLKLDLSNMSATLVQSFYPSSHVLSSSQGSVQTFPDGRMFTGYGSSALWTEHAADGTLQCEVHFSASVVYAWEWVKSYRTFKAFGWVGRPSYPPVAKIQGQRGFVSWNGATEVKKWQLQGRRPDSQEEGDGSFETIEDIEKSGFESSSTLPSFGEYTHYRFAALDDKGEVMDLSNVVEPVQEASVFWKVLFGLAFAAVILLTAAGVIVWWRRRRRDINESGAVAATAATAAARGWSFPWESKSLLGWGRRGQYQYSRL